LRVGGCRGSRQPAASRSLSFSLSPSAVAAMVKVSFNSALAQKEAAKKEEENSQVLILPPDAKVRAAGTERRGRPTAPGQRSARLPACCSGRGAAGARPHAGAVSLFVFRSLVFFSFLKSLLAITR